MSTRVVSFHYEVRSEAGDLIDSSQGSEPMTYLEGSGQIIPGLEEELQTMKAGDKKNVKVAPEKAYGQREQEMIFDVPRSKFPPNEKVEIGMKFRAGDPGEPSPVFTVTKVTDENVTVDGNHPLAGQALVFNVEVTGIRDATLDEIKHGHAHGKGGHHH